MAGIPGIPGIGIPGIGMGIGIGMPICRGGGGIPRISGVDSRGFIIGGN